MKLCYPNCQSSVSRLGLEIFVNKATDVLADFNVGGIFSN